jgi:hypothetical protein
VRIRSACAEGVGAKTIPDPPPPLRHPQFHFLPFPSGQQTQHKPHRSPHNRLPAVHTDPHPVRLLRVKTCFDHDPLELSRILPFLQLRRPQPASNPGIEISVLPVNLPPSAPPRFGVFSSIRFAVVSGNALALLTSSFRPLTADHSVPDSRLERRPVRHAWHTQHPGAWPGSG